MQLGGKGRIPQYPIANRGLRLRDRESNEVFPFKLFVCRTCACGYRDRTKILGFVFGQAPIFEMARRARHAFNGQFLCHITDEAQLQSEARVDLLSRWRHAGFIVDDNKVAVCSPVNTVHTAPDRDAFDVDRAGLLGNRNHAAFFSHQPLRFIRHPA